VAAAAAIVFLLIAIAVPNFVRSRSTSASNAVINNLRQIDTAKQQWALEHGKTDTDVATLDDIKPYLRGGKAPASIMGENYVLGRVGEPVFAEAEGDRAKNQLGRLPTRGAPGQKVRMSSDGQLAFVDQNASEASFRKYVDQAQRKLADNQPLGRGDDVRIVDNRVQVSGQVTPPDFRNWPFTRRSASGRCTARTNRSPIPGEFRISRRKQGN